MGSGKGKRRVEIKQLEDQKQRMVTFSKRRQGLFKKAQEYATITGSHVAVLVFSPAGKPFIHGSPSFDAMVESFLNGCRCESDIWEPFVGLREKVKVSESVEELMEVKTVLEEVRERVLKRLGDLEDEKFVGSLLNC